MSAVTYLHGGSTDPPREYAPPVVIRQDRFVCELRDLDVFLELPITNVRKLWKIMFDSAWENGDAIDAICDWLLEIFPIAQNFTERGVAKPKHKRVLRLQEIFDQKLRKLRRI